MRVHKRRNKWRRLKGAATCARGALIVAAGGEVPGSLQALADAARAMLREQRIEPAFGDALPIAQINDPRRGDDHARVLAMFDRAIEAEKAAATPSG